MAESEELKELLDSANEGEAIVEYGDAEFTVIKSGGFVRCAVTGVRIRLEALKYWNVDTQEAYVDAVAATKGFGLGR